MSEVTYTLAATPRNNAYDAVPGTGESTSGKYLVATKSVTARTEDDTMKVITLPSNARLAGTSKLSWDDLASAESPTMDAGLAPASDYANDYTADPDALSAGHDVTSAGTGLMIADHANYGKPLWELMGETEDPGILIDIYLSFVDAATNVTGDVTAEVSYYFD